MTMSIIEKVIIPLMAAFLGAILAFVYQKRNQAREDKKNIFATLMAYRNFGTYEEDFVKALNLVSVVYHKHDQVKKAYHKYLTAYNNPIYSDSDRVNCVFSLLEEMAKALGYTLTHNDIKDYFRISYLPRDTPQSGETEILSQK